MRVLTAKRIVQLLEAPIEDPWPTIRLIQARAAEDEVVAALDLPASPETRFVLCSILGERHVGAAVPVLAATLQDADARVRSAAADALAKIGDTHAGPALTRQLESEERTGVRQMLALALGACRYEPAISMLLGLLEDPDATMRGCAAWSLGFMHVNEAQPALEQALWRETEKYPQTRMEVALNEIRAFRAASQ